MAFSGIALRNAYVYYHSAISPDRIVATEESFRALSKALPDVHRVGFITDVPRNNRSKYLERYFAARYAMVPRLVEEGASSEWVIVNAVMGASNIPSDL